MPKRVTYFDVIKMIFIFVFIGIGFVYLLLNLGINSPPPVGLPSPISYCDYAYGGTEFYINGVIIPEFKHLPFGHNLIFSIENEYNVSIGENDCSPVMHYDFYDQLSKDPSRYRVIANTTTQSAENKLIDNTDWFIVDRLNEIWVGDGTAEGSITGQRETEEVSGGLFYTTSYTHYYSINDKINMDFKFTIRSEKPTKELSESDFKRLGASHKKRCIRVYNTDVKLDDNTNPYNLICAFDDDGIQFITNVESTLTPANGFIINKDFNVYAYMQIDSSDETSWVRWSSVAVKLPVVPNGDINYFK